MSFVPKGTSWFSFRGVTLSDFGSAASFRKGCADRKGATQKNVRELCREEQDCVTWSPCFPFFCRIVQQILGDGWRKSSWEGPSQPPSVCAWSSISLESWGIFWKVQGVLAWSRGVSPALSPLSLICCTASGNCLNSPASLCRDIFWADFSVGYL